MAMADHSPEATPLIGESPAFLSMLEHVSRAAKLNKPVLVIGERGTGKELVAARLHFLSPRWDQPLVKLNCAALTESLLESELFGHEAGAFTGASQRHIGRFERAEGGTLFLDELATVPPRMQEKILRVIEYGEFERVGGSETLRADVRIVAATNEDLPQMANRGEFRSDLLDRLAFDVITVPPLRARTGDIRPLADHFAVTITSELRRPFFAGFSEEALVALQDHEWPGNVRELKNAVERSVYLGLPDAPVEKIVFDPFESPYRLGAAESPPSGRQSPTWPVDLKAEVRDLERTRIQQALADHGYHQGRAASALQLSYHQLRSYLRKHKIAGRRGDPKTALAEKR